MLGIESEFCVFVILYGLKFVLSKHLCSCVFFIDCHVMMILYSDRLEIIIMSVFLERLSM